MGKKMQFRGSFRVFKGLAGEVDQVVTPMGCRAFTPGLVHGSQGAEVFVQKLAYWQSVIA